MPRFSLRTARLSFEGQERIPIGLRSCASVSPSFDERKPSDGYDTTVDRPLFFQDFETTARELLRELTGVLSALSSPPSAVAASVKGKNIKENVRVTPSSSQAC